jgi:uncharacterized phage protein (TIGR01671 family)
MRTIKFRAWDKENKCMRKNVGVSETFVEYDISCHQPVDIMIPMQWTGLIDKNGKEIYEGDFVQDERVIDVYENYKEIVKFGEHTTDSGYGDNVVVYGFYTESCEGNRGYTTALIPDDANNMQVIGNIYENPELLESEK